MPQRARGTPRCSGSLHEENNGHGIQQVVSVVRAANKMIHRQMAMAFTKWYEEALSIAAEKYRLTSAINRWRNRLLTEAWNQWMYRAASLARCEMVMTQSITSWMLRDMVKGF